MLRPEVYGSTAMGRAYSCRVSDCFPLHAYKVLLYPGNLPNEL